MSDIIEQCANRIAQMVRERDWLSMVEVEQALADLIPTSGDMAIHKDGAPNLIFWAGTTNEVRQVIQYLVAHNLVEVYAGSVMSYMVDGKMLNFPIYKGKVAPEKLRHPHWIPSFLRPYGVEKTSKTVKTKAPSRQHRSGKKGRA